MKSKAQESYKRIQKSIEDEASRLDRDQYVDFISELLSHLRGLQDCIDEERRAE